MVLEEAGSPPWDSAGRASNCLLFFFRSASILPTTALSATTAPASRSEPTLRAASLPILLNSALTVRSELGVWW